MTWLLIVLGAAFIVFSIWFAFELRHTTHVQESVPAEEQLSASPTPTKFIDTDAVPSETTFVALVSLGVLMILAGAFYGRITKLSFAGNTIEMVALGRVGKAMMKLASQGRLQDLSPSKVIAATELAAQEAVGLMKLAQIDPVLLKSLQPLDQRLSDEDVKRITVSGSPSDDLWDRLAEAALKKVSEQTE